MIPMWKWKIIRQAHKYESTKETNIDGSKNILAKVQFIGDLK